MYITSYFLSSTTTKKTVETNQESFVANAALARPSLLYVLLSTIACAIAMKRYKMPFSCLSVSLVSQMIHYCNTIKYKNSDRD
jgi:hypothetical protein